MPLPQIIENENTVDVDIKTNLRNCNLCIHQGICSAFANFKIDTLQYLQLAVCFMDIFSFEHGRI